MNDILEDKTDKVRSQLVVRISTACWHDRRGAYVKKNIMFQKRLSSGPMRDCFLEDCSNAGFDQVVERIINLDKCKDGLYDVVMCNISTDWETGCIDDWDYRLEPYVKESKNENGIRSSVLQTA